MVFGSICWYFFQHKLNIFSYQQWYCTLHILLIDLSTDQTHCDDIWIYSLTFSTFWSYSFDQFPDWVIISFVHFRMIAHPPMIFGGIQGKLVDFPLADHLKSNIIRGLIGHTWSLYTTVTQSLFFHWTYVFLGGYFQQRNCPLCICSIKAFIRRQGGNSDQLGENQF